MCERLKYASYAKIKNTGRNLDCAALIKI